MNTLDDLRETFESMAGDSDGLGMVEAARAGAARIRRRRIAGAAAAAVLVAAVAVVVPVAVVRLRADPLPATPVPHRAPSEMTLSVVPAPGTYVAHQGNDAARQFVIVRNLDHSAENLGGSVTAYDPGAYDPTAFLRAERVTVAGHPAYLVPPEATDPIARPPQRAALGWRDPSGVWITVADTESRAALLRLAETVRVGPLRPIATPMQFGWIPGGLPLRDAASVGDGVGDPSDEGFATAGFAAGPAPAFDPRTRIGARRSVALRIYVQTRRGSGWRVILGMQPRRTWETIGGRRASYLPESLVDGPSPGSGAHLLTEVGDCGLLVEAADRALIGKEDMVRMVTDMTFSRCTDPATWRPVLR